MIEASDHDKAGLGQAMKIIDRISDSFETRLTHMEARLQSERAWHEAVNPQAQVTSSHHGAEELFANLTAVCRDVEDLRRQQIKSNCEIQLLRTQLDTADRESESTNDVQSGTSMSRSCGSSLSAVTSSLEVLRTELRNELQQLRGQYVDENILEELQQLLGECAITRKTLEEQAAHGRQLEATQTRHSQEIEVLQQQCSQLAGSLQANLAAIRGEFVDLCERSARMAEGLQCDMQDSVRTQVLHAIAQQQSGGSDAHWQNVEAHVEARVEKLQQQLAEHQEVLEGPWRLDAQLLQRLTEGQGKLSLEVDGLQLAWLARVEKLQLQLAEHQEALEGPCRLDAQLLQRLAEGHSKLSLEVEGLQLAWQKKSAGAKQDDAMATTGVISEDLQAIIQELCVVQGSMVQQQQEQSIALTDLESAKRVFEEALDAETTRRCSLIADLHARLAREIAEVHRQVELQRDGKLEAGFKTAGASRSPGQIDWDCPQDVERLAAMIKKEWQKQKAIHGATTVDYRCRIDADAEAATHPSPEDTRHQSRQDSRSESISGSGARSPRELFGGSLNATPLMSIRATPSRQHSSEQVGSITANPGYTARPYLGQSWNKERTDATWASGEFEPHSLLGAVEVSSEKQLGLVRRPLPAHRLSSSRDWLPK